MKILSFLLGLSCVTSAVVAASPLICPPRPSVLMASYKKDLMLPVVRVNGNDPYVLVENNEKLVRIQPRYEFKAADDFADNFIDCAPGSLAGRFGVQVIGERTNPYTLMDGQFDLKATVTAHRTIKHGFITVVLGNSIVFGELIVHDLPELPANTPTKIKLSVRITSNSSQGSFFFAQIFDDSGKEVLTTDVDFASSYFQRDAQNRLRMATLFSGQKLKGQDRGAVPFYTPRVVLDRGIEAPEGELSAELTVSTAGIVTAVNVAQIKDEHARSNVISAISGWLYLPELKAGMPVEAHITVPVSISVARKNTPSPN